MGLLDFLTGNADADPTKPRLSRDELYQRLLALKDPDGTWYVHPAEDDGSADLVAEWGPISQSFVALYGASGRKASKRVLLRLIDEESVVRSVDHDGEFIWEAGWTHFRFEVSGFRGQKREIGGTWTFGKTADGGFGKTASTWWDTDAIKRPLRETVADAGWGWHGVAFAKL